MAGNNVRRNFIGDQRLCSKCKGLIVVTNQMAKTGKYTCLKCQSNAAGAWAVANREKKRAHNNKYHSKHSAQRSETTAMWRAANPEKAKAYIAVQTAIINGSLIRRPCKECGSKRVHAHHEDYSKPTEVLWLCHKHHMLIHGRYMEARKK